MVGVNGHFQLEKVHTDLNSAMAYLTVGQAVLNIIRSNTLYKETINSTCISCTSI
jgi:hypothetical protein